MTFILFILLSFLLQGALGELVCEELSIGLCTFSIASSGKRCILENYVANNGNMEYQCKTSEIVVESMNGFIESDECINACGVHRMSLGISSDSLLEPHFVAKLCSRSCYNNCPNIIDLYRNIAIGEGVVNLCEVHRIMSRRSMAHFLSSGAVSGHISGAEAPSSNEIFNFTHTSI